MHVTKDKRANGIEFLPLLMLVLVLMLIIILLVMEIFLDFYTTFSFKSHLQSQHAAKDVFSPIFEVAPGGFGSYFFALLLP